jgi:hypothetical protein
MASSKKQAPARKNAPAPARKTAKNTAAAPARKTAAAPKPKPRGAPRPARPSARNPDADRAPGPSGGLAVLVDGVALPADAAEAVWRAFSAWMDGNQGDLDGFARQRGFRVRPCSSSRAEAARISELGDRSAPPDANREPRFTATRRHHPPGTLTVEHRLPDSC